MNCFCKICGHEWNAENEFTADDKRRIPSCPHCESREIETDRFVPRQFMDDFDDED
jgi:predicted Zn-ribbon and HTH transcriptional regulator